MSIFDVRHQDRAHRVVQRALASRRMPHAYLFVGPEGVGREMLATRLAQLLLCAAPMHCPAPPGLADDLPEGRGLDACDRCDDCRLVRAGTHPDLFLIHRQLVRQHPDAGVRRQKALFLGVEVIRHFLVDRAGLRPSRGRARVFIIREADRLNDAAANSLLKTLEEPPLATFLILVTTGLDRMLPTIRSRCQPVFFAGLPEDFLGERIAALRPGASSKEIGYLAGHCEGSLGLALQRFDDGVCGMASAWEQRLRRLHPPVAGLDPQRLAADLLGDARTLAERFAEREPEASDADALRAGLLTLLSVLAGIYREALRAGYAPAGSESLDGPSGGASDDPLPGQAIRLLADTEESLARNASPELAIETLFIRLARLPRPV